LLNVADGRIPNGLFHTAEAKALPGDRVSSPWDIWYGSDIPEGEQPAMGHHPVVRSFFVSDVGLE